MRCEHWHGFFGADAAAIYGLIQPGRPLELLDAYRFPPSAPRRLGTGESLQLLNGRGRIVEAHILNAADGVWAQAAEEACWSDALVYTLPRCPARLVLTYCQATPSIDAGVANLALRSIALFVRIRQNQARYENLHTSHNKLDHMMQAGIDRAQEGIVMVDRDARVLVCNSQCSTMLGYESSEIAGFPADEVLVSPENIGATLINVLSGQSKREECTIKLVNRFGEPLAVDLSIEPLCLPNHPAPFGALVAFAEQKDRLLDEAEEHVRQRIVQMEATISSLAHEIGNPLGSILMIVQHLQRKIGDQEHMGVHLGRIRDDITRIDRLLKDALQSTRSTEPRVFPQDITKLLDGLLVGREQLLVDNRIIVYKQYHPDLPLALIDREKIQQVFDNLIINAIHAMPDGGHLAISVNKARIPNGTLNGDRQVLEIKVGDTGIGISQEIQERIFDPYFTTKGGKGSGLGLAVARRIVGKHNGTIEVESTPSAGTIFTVRLPIKEKSSE